MIRTVVTLPSLFFLWNHVVSGAIFDFDLVLKPSQEFVQYNDGYIRGPGMIDLSDLTFTAVSEAYGYGFDDDAQYALGDDDDNYRNRRLEGGIEHDATFIDIAVFPLPSSCAKKNSCDWTELGVGKRSSADELRWCCSDDAMALGLCQGDDASVGRLMIDPKKFKGETRSISVPREGDMTKHLKTAKVEIKKSSSYVVLYANCNEQGREVAVQGKSVWKSKHGYLPGELFGFMYFYTFVFIIYLVLFAWFAYLMMQFQETRIEIQKWIIFSISLGLLEMTFRCCDYYIWNGSGFRSNSIIWVGILIGVLKQGLSRCLCVMVSMGWGVSRESISGTARMMSIGLAIGYIVTSGLSDCLLVFAIEHMNTISYKEEKEIVNVVSLLGYCKVVVELFFIVWVLIALSKTLSYLEKNNEKTKLERMQQLMNVFLVAVFFTIGMILFQQFDKASENGIVAEEHAWAMDAASEVSYLFVLIGIALIWCPSENSQKYAYFKELSPMYMDDEEDELEMSDVNG